MERPAGDHARNIQPFYHRLPHPERSLYWFAYNLNKKAITLDIETADGRDIFKRLVKTADIVIESFPVGYLEGLGLGYPALSAVNPSIVMTSITPYGQQGPYKDYKASDITLMAMGGFLYITGYPTGPRCVSAFLSPGCWPAPVPPRRPIRGVAAGLRVVVGVVRIDEVPLRPRADRGGRREEEHQLSLGDDAVEVRAPLVVARAVADEEQEAELRWSGAPADRRGRGRERVLLGRSVVQVERGGEVHPRHERGLGNIFHVVPTRMSWPCGRPAPRPRRPRTRGAGAGTRARSSACHPPGGCARRCPG